ncbi:hypothetical protein [Pseudoalteromonas tunicata]
MSTHVFIYRFIVSVIFIISRME